MLARFFRSNKNPAQTDQRGKFRLRPTGKVFTLIIMLIGFSGLLIAACTDDATRKPARPTLSNIQQLLIWDTKPAEKITEGEITPFLAKAVFNKKISRVPPCQPEYSLAKTGAADATISLKGKTLTGMKLGVVTLTASCPPDASYETAPIEAKVEIVAKPKSNFQFGIYMDPMVAYWKKTAAEAAKSELLVTEPGYSMYSYIDSVLANNPTGTIAADATFLILNDKPGAYAVDYSLQKDSTSYLLSLSYKPSPTETEFLAVRVAHPKIGKVAGKSYEIKNPDDLLKMRWNLAGNYTLTKSLSLPTLTALNYLAIPKYKTEGWLPVATEANPFSGTLDGKGNTIMNLISTSLTAPGVSLLGFLDGANIKDLKLKNASIAGSDYTGLLAGKAKNVTLENIQGQLVTNGVATVLAGTSYVGGLIGEVVNTDPTKTLKNLSVDGDLVALDFSNRAAPANLGGIFGSLTGNLESASYVGSVVGDQTVGGIVGTLKGKIHNAQVLGSFIKGFDRVGGIAGSFESGEISQVISSIELSGSYGRPGTSAGLNNVFGGIAGYAKGTISRAFAEVKIMDTSAAAGGLVGLYGGAATDSITDSYAKPTFSNVTFAQTGGLVGGVLSTATLTMKRSFVTAWPKTRATAIVGGSTAAPNLEAVYFPASVQGTGELQGSSAMAANSPTYDASFAGYKTGGFWQFDSKANWPILINLPAEPEPVAIQ